MFTFAFDDALFRFQLDSPAFEPLFQFPPNTPARTPYPFLQTKAAGGGPPDPPKELF